MNTTKVTFTEIEKMNKTEIVGKKFITIEKTETQSEKKKRSRLNDPEYILFKERSAYRKEPALKSNAKQIKRPKKRQQLNKDL